MRLKYLTGLTFGLLMFSVVAKADTSAPSVVVLKVGDVTISEAELQTKMGAIINQSQKELYQQKVGYLERQAKKILFEKAAKEARLNVKEWAKKEIESKVSAPTAEEMEQIYKQNPQLDKTKPDVQKQVIDYLMNGKMRVKEQEVYTALAQKAGVQITVPAPVLLDIRAEYTENEVVKGNPKAPVTILEFTDFQCPWCQRSQPTLKAVAETFKDQVKFVSRQFPLQMHSGAMPAAHAALCAKDQGKFWEYHDLLFSGNKFSGDDFKQYAKDLKLNLGKFEKCVTSQKFADQIAKDLEDGERFGVQGTPAFFINGIRYEGSPVDVEAFKKAVQAELDKTKK